MIGFRIAKIEVQILFLFTQMDFIAFYKIIVANFHLSINTFLIPSGQY